METAKIMNTIELQKMVDKLCTEKDAAVHSAAKFIKENIKQQQEILKLTARIAELEAERKKAFDLVRKLRMYCIYANWDNPDTEDEFNEFDAEVCEYLSEYKVCVDQLTAHSDIERQDDKCSGHGDISNFPPVMGSGDGLGW